MFAQLHFQYSRIISITLLVVMILSVLQFCIMSSAFGNTGIPSGMVMSGHDMPAEMMDHKASGRVNNDSSMAGNNLTAHDCCDDQGSSSEDVVCPDCEDEEPAMQAGIPDHIEPLFSLLYVIFRDVLNLSSRLTNWQAVTEPEILSTLPKIYLAKASFLE